MAILGEFNKSLLEIETAMIGRDRWSVDDAMGLATKIADLSRAGVSHDEIGEAFRNMLESNIGQYVFCFSDLEHYLKLAALNRGGELVDRLRTISEAHGERNVYQRMARVLRVAALFPFRHPEAAAIRLRNSVVNLLSPKPEQPFSTLDHD